MERVRHDSSQVRVRHIKRSATGTTVLGVVYAGDWDGLNGRMGFVSGTLERRLYEEGTGTLRLPNSAGPDGVLHRDRFACLSDPGYLPGDEWLEVYEDNDLVAVWTPTGRQSKRRSELQISGEDATTLLKRTREGSAGYWRHSPRTVMEHYSRLWVADVAEGFGPGETALTYSTSPQTAGVWTYTRCQTDPVNYPGQARLTSGGPGAIPSLAATGTGLHSNTASSIMFALGGGAWRIECELSAETVVAGDYVRFGLFDSVYSAYIAAVDVYYDKVVFDAAPGGGAVQMGLAQPLTAGVPLKLAIESHREQFVHYYANGKLGCIAYRGTYTTSGYPKVEGLGLASGSAVRVASVAARHAAPCLMPGDTGHPETEGDKHLPGDATPGGLWGSYYDCNDWRARGWANLSPFVNVAPGTDPVAERLDAGVTFATATPSTWRPPGVPAGWFIAHWTGSVYLDFDNYDYTLRTVSAGAANDTAQAVLCDIHSSTTAWLNANTLNSAPPSGGARRCGPSGWYPLVVGYAHHDPAGAAQMRLEWMRSDAIGTWTAVPATALSPYGIYREQVRNESHYDALKAVADTFGYQWTCEPRSLESGEFPGRIIPRARVGRDTERVLDEPESTDIQADIDVDARADAIQADASGLADPSGGGQLSAEILDLPALGDHLFVGQEYESLSDISQMNMLEQRLGSLMTLRSAVWEEISARPPGHRELLDSWPLTGGLAEFAWEPGDGIRLNFPTVGVVDAICRQVLGVSREFVPDGMRPPAASFRPRPRSVKSLMRQVRRDALLPQRNYQQQLAQITGSVGGVGGADGYTRIALPPAAALIAVQLLTLYKSDTSAWNMQINLIASSLNVRDAGRVDVTNSMVPGGGANFVTLTGGTGTWTIQLVATVRV